MTNFDVKREVDGSSALKIAAQNGNIFAVNFLLKKDSNINAVDKKFHQSLLLRL